MIGIKANFLNQVYILLPEIQLTISALLLQMLGIFYKRSKQLISYFSIISMLSVLYYINRFTPKFIGDAFNQMYQVTHLSIFAKSIVIITTSLALLLYSGLSTNSGFAKKSEYSTLTLLCIVGIFIMVSSGHFLTLYLGLELQSLSLYLLTSFDRDNFKSSEAGLKYFILGALASCIMLFGISLVYGFTGTLEFNVIQNLYNKEHFLLSPPAGVIVGVYMIIVGILFKLSIAPFHAWTPDIYEGAPLSTVALLSSCAKFGSLIVLINLTMKIFNKDTLFTYHTSIQTLAFLSMTIGALGAIQQSSLKRLLGYSTILNMGYILVALAANNSKAIEAALMFMIIYSFTLLGLLALFTLTLGNKIENALLEDLSGISALHKFSTFGISILLFSLIGIPPFAGFFAKLYIFKAAIQAKLYNLALIGVIASVVSAYYYLKIIKIMHFDKISFNMAKDISHKDKKTASKELISIAIIALIINIVFIISPNLPHNLIINAIETF